MPDRYDVIIVGAGPGRIGPGDAVGSRRPARGLARCRVVPAPESLRRISRPGPGPCSKCWGCASSTRIVAGPQRIAGAADRRPAGARQWNRGKACAGCPQPIPARSFAAGSRRPRRAEVMLETRVGDVLIDHDRATGITARFGTATAPLQLKARAIVAADGRNSRIVAQTGQRLRRGPAIVGFKRYAPPEDAAELPPGMLEMHSLSGGYVGVCRVEDGQTNLCGVLPRRLVSAARFLYGSHRPVDRRAAGLERAT